MGSSGTLGTLSTTGALSSAVASSNNSVNVVSVKAHIPVVLDFTVSNYTKWCQFFTTMCGKFGLLAHINGSAPPRPDDPAWAQADFSVLSWMYGSVSSDILDMTMEPDQHARDLWVAIEEEFRNNKEQRAIYISNQFHTLMQGDMTVAAYCQRLKQLADSLRDLGFAVSDPQLVLNMIRGLAPRFKNQADKLDGAGTAFPSFASARSTLLMAELRMNNAAAAGNESALVAASAPACSASGCANSGGASSSKKAGKQPRSLAAVQEV
ncbi:hypothetical protein ACP70R_006476 [Stipagrostis hirtigluma subsp. patula]